MKRFFLLALLSILILKKLRAQIWIDINSLNSIENGTYSYPYHNISFGIKQSLNLGIKNLTFILIQSISNSEYEMFDEFPNNSQITFASQSE